MKSPSDTLESPWYTDPFWPVILALGVAVCFWTVRQYPSPPPPLPFPRHISECRPQAVLAASRAASLAVLADRPDDISAHVDLVLACYEGGPTEYVKGLEYLEHARDLGALDERLFYYAGVMYETEGLSEYAVPEYERYLRRHPEDLETRLRLANLFYKMGELDKSIEAYRFVLAQKPNDLLVSYNLAFVFREKKSWAEGLSSLKPFFDSQKPFPVGGHKLLGDLYLGSGDAQRAMGEFEREQARSGENADLASSMAQAAESLGQKDVAVLCWNKVMAFDPANREARAHLRKLKQPVPGRRR